MSGKVSCQGVKWLKCVKLVKLRSEVCQVGTVGQGDEYVEERVRGTREKQERNMRGTVLRQAPFEL